MKKLVDLFDRLRSRQVTLSCIVTPFLIPRLGCQSSVRTGQLISPLGIQFSFNNNTIVLNPAPASKEKAEPSVTKKAKPSGEKAQTTPEKHKVVGLVKEANGEPIIGASVFVKGTKIGTVTNTDGEFSLDVPANATLLVSYIGFTTQEIALKGSTNLNIVLKEDEAQALNEVVVVGYGTQKKATVTGAIASVSTKDLVQTPQANISNMSYCYAAQWCSWRGQFHVVDSWCEHLFRQYSPFGDD